MRAETNPLPSPLPHDLFTSITRICPEKEPLSLRCHFISLRKGCQPLPSRTTRGPVVLDSCLEGPEFDSPTRHLWEVGTCAFAGPLGDNPHPRPNSGPERSELPFRPKIA